MSWWQQLCISTATAFFAGLVNSSEKVKIKSKAYALQIFNAIKLAYYGDPDFQ